MLTALGRAAAPHRALLLPTLALLAPLLAPAPAGAQQLAPVVPAPAAEDAQPAAAEEGRVEGLIAALEDPERRAELIRNLRALLAAGEGIDLGDGAAEAAPEATADVAAQDLLAWLAGEVSARVDTVRQVAVSVVDSIDQIPFLFAWLRHQVENEARRELWLEVGARVALILGAGVAAYTLTALALRTARSRFRRSPRGADGGDVPLRRLLGWHAVEFLPVLVFAVAAYVTLAMLHPRDLTRLVVKPLIDAGLIGRATVAALRVLFAPKAPGLRPLPISDAGAAYAFRWCRRIASTAIYGTFILEAARRLSLPWTIYGFLLHLLYLAVAGMVIAVIVQRREAVAAAIARLGEADGPAWRRSLPWWGLAEVWHVLAILAVACFYLAWALKIPGGFRFLLTATLGTVVVLAGAWAALRALARLAGPERPALVEGEEPHEHEEEAGPHAAAPPAPPARRYAPAAVTLGRILVGVVAALAVLQVWGVDVRGWFETDAGAAFAQSAFTALVVAGGTLALWEVAGRALERVMAAKDPAGNLVYSARARTLLTIARSTLLVFLGLMAALLVLSELGVNIAPLLAGAGVIGLAIGFGSQKLVQDIITGMFVLLGDTMRVGDVVQVGGRAGVVEAVTMRTVRLRGYEGYVHTIPYSAIDTVTNMTKDFSFWVFEVGVAYKEDINQVMDVMRAIGAEMRRDRNFRRLILEPLEVAGVDRFADSAVIIKARIKTLPLKQWEVGREFNRRMKMRFDELGIEIPFPHQTVYFGADKRGEAAPVRVRVEDRTPPPVPEVRQPAPPPREEAAE